MKHGEKEGIKHKRAERQTKKEGGLEKGREEEEEKDEDHGSWWAESESTRTITKLPINLNEEGWRERGRESESQGTKHNVTYKQTNKQINTPHHGHKPTSHQEYTVQHIISITMM